VVVLGRDIHDPSLNVYELRKQVGMVFQKPCVFPQSIYENVIFGLKFHAIPNGKSFPERSEQALRDVFLWDEVKDRLRDPAHTLSQGQQQRLAMARTLAVDPEILLMDEPTSALDPKSSRAIEDLILSLKDRHTLVLVTHNVDQAERVAEDLICVDDKTICHKPCHPLPGEGTG
jgi:phosphate transport system ATP-binding protein